MSRSDFGQGKVDLIESEKRLGICISYELGIGEGILCEVMG